MILEEIGESVVEVDGRVQVAGQVEAHEAGLLQIAKCIGGVDHLPLELWVGVFMAEMPVGILGRHCLVQRGLQLGTFGVVQLQILHVVCVIDNGHTEWSKDGGEKKQ